MDKTKWNVISKSEADIFNVPLLDTSKRIPFRIGIVVLDVTALETIFNALVRTDWLHVNFILKTSEMPSFSYINLVVIVVGAVDSVDNFSAPCNIIKI